MSRKIILLSDGTGNSSATIWRTNVWRVFESLDLSGDRQVAFYDDGVGTASFKPIALLGGAFGYGLKRNVIDIYKFACRNYKSPSDEIYGFGFSRGAFTMRVVAGLILDQGLVQARSEPELHAKATQAYRAYRGRFRTIWPNPLRPERWGRAIRSWFTREKLYKKSQNLQVSGIRFLGLWDTVAAYGLPVDEMTLGVSKFLWPLMLPDCALDPRVVRACHALSLDDERTTFHPVLWDERNEAPLEIDANGESMLVNERISQVWFAGMHANVGGGYPDDSLAHVPLSWIMREAEHAGLSFKTIPEANPQTIGHPPTVRDKDGRIYDSRSGLGGYYRYGPRDVLALCGKLIVRKGCSLAIPRIHQSVFDRIKNQAHAYAPIGIPERYDVVTDDGVVKRGGASLYETSTMATARYHDQQRVWNAVSIRDIVYFLTVLVSSYLFVIPLLRDRDGENELSSSVGWISDTLTFLRRVLPSAADPWISVFAQNPGTFATAVVAIVVLLKISAGLAGAIESRMAKAWRTSFDGSLTDGGEPKNWLFRIRKSKGYQVIHDSLKFWVAPAMFAILFALIGVSLVNRTIFGLRNYSGYVCKASNTKNTLSSGEFVTRDGGSLKLADQEAEAIRRGIISEDGEKDPLKYLPRLGIRLPEFHPNSVCQNMGVIVERPGHYTIRFESTESFSDFNGRLFVPFGYFMTKVVKQEVRSKADPNVGKMIPENDMSYRQIFMSFLSLPFRREFTHPWFRVFARVGDTGGDETVLEPDPYEDRYKINAIVDVRHKGELFLFVNDAVVGLPWIGQWAYGNNRGSTQVLILQR